MYHKPVRHQLSFYSKSRQQTDNLRHYTGRHGHMFYFETVSPATSCVLNSGQILHFLLKIVTGKCFTCFCLTIVWLKSLVPSYFRKFIFVNKSIFGMFLGGW